VTRWAGERSVPAREEILSGWKARAMMSLAWVGVSAMMSSLSFGVGGVVKQELL
jgi:hypothetical protein